MSLHRFERAGDLVLTYDGDRLTYEEPAILEAPPAHTEEDAHRWRIPIEFEFGMEHGRTCHARGWAAIRARGSTSDAGFALFQDRRLIVGSDDQTYRPVEIFGRSNSFAYQRVFGELDLEGVDLSHSKDSFNWRGVEESFIEELRDSLTGEVDLLYQAREYRATHAEHKTVDRAQSAVESTADELRKRLAEAAESWATSADGDEGSTEQLGDALQEQTTFSRELEATVANQAWKVELALANDPAVPDWLTLTDSAWTDATLTPRQLHMRLNLAHPFLRRFASPTGDEMEAIVRIAAALMLAEVTVRQGLNPDERAMKLLRRRTNQVLTALAEGHEG